MAHCLPRCPITWSWGGVSERTCCLRHVITDLFSSSFNSRDNCCGAFSPALLRYDWQINTYLRCTVWYFSICTLCEMITKSKLISISITSQSCLWRVCGENTEIHPPSTCQVCNTELLATVPVLNIGAPELSHLIAESLYPLASISSASPRACKWDREVFAEGTVF